MFSTSFIIILVLCLIVLILAVHAFILENRLKKLFRGENGKSLEKIIAEMQSRLNAHNLHAIKNSNDIGALAENMKSKVKSVKAIRFKPFEDAGSNQSFAIAIIDDHQDGVILSSLYTRDRMSVFAKPIANGKSEYELTNEEKNVLESVKQESK